MLGFLRLVVFGFLALSVIYLALSFYSRSVRRGKLAREWDEEGMQGDRDAFIAQGLKDYDQSLRPKLLLGVYVIPVVLIGTIIYVIN